MFLQWWVDEGVLVPTAPPFLVDGRSSHLCFPVPQAPALLRGVMGVPDVQ